MKIGDKFKIRSTEYKILDKIDRYTWKVASPNGTYDMDEAEIEMHMNPYPHEHSARLHSPKGRYVRFRRQNSKFGRGVHAVWGIPPNVSKQHLDLQAIRFDAKLFTPVQAKAWLRNHGVWSQVIKFEAAKGRVMKKNKPIHKPGTVSWYIGLTKDFRKWDVISSLGDPNHSHKYRNYIWFYGPFKTEEEAKLFNRIEFPRSNPKSACRKIKGYRKNPCSKIGAGDIIIATDNSKWMIVSQRGCKYDLQNTQTLEMAHDVSLNKLISSMKDIVKG